jgi:hypothetical protein
LQAEAQAVAIAQVTQLQAVAVVQVVYYRARSQNQLDNLSQLLLAQAVQAQQVQVQMVVIVFLTLLPQQAVAALVLGIVQQALQVDQAVAVLVVPSQKPIWVGQVLADKATQAARLTHHQLQV